jgi:hypothetical protein
MSHRIATADPSEGLCGDLTRGNPAPQRRRSGEEARAYPGARAPGVLLELVAEPRTQLGLALERTAGTKVIAVALSIAYRPTAGYVEVIGDEIEIELPISVVDDRSEFRMLGTVGRFRHS